MPKSSNAALLARRIIIIMTMFTQGNLFNTRSAVINEGPERKVVTLQDHPRPKLTIKQPSPINQNTNVVPNIKDC